MRAPPEKIYAYLADFRNHAEWSSNVRKIELVAGETGKVGAEYEAIEDIPSPMTTFARITGLRAPTLITWEATDKRVFKTNWRCEIEPRGDVSLVTLTVAFEPLTVFANVILYLVRVPRVANEDRASLERIKAILEKG